MSRRPRRAAAKLPGAYAEIEEESPLKPRRPSRHRTRTAQRLQQQQHEEEEEEEEEQDEDEADLEESIVGQSDSDSNSDISDEENNNNSDEENNNENEKNNENNNEDEEQEEGEDESDVSLTSIPRALRNLDPSEVKKHVRNQEMGITTRRSTRSRLANLKHPQENDGMRKDDAVYEPENEDDEESDDIDDDDYVEDEERPGLRRSQRRSAGKAVQKMRAGAAVHSRIVLPRRRVHNPRPTKKRRRNTYANEEKASRESNGEVSSSATEGEDSDDMVERRMRKRDRIDRGRLQPLNFEQPFAQGESHGTRKKSELADVAPMLITADSVKWEHVGGLDSHISALKEMVVLPLMYPQLLSSVGVSPPRGVLFHGPPGTGKTLVARALAAQCARLQQDGRPVAFFMRKGADCLSKWVGEAERQLRLLFDEARKQQPAVIFFDEIDGLAPVRSSKQDQIHASIVSTLLALMDGLDDRGQVVVIGATNRPDAIDPALRRPGRFDRELRFALPTRDARRGILGIHTRKWQPQPDPKLLDRIADKAAGYAGADLRALCTEAALRAVRRTFPHIYESDQRLRGVQSDKVVVLDIDFEGAMQRLLPSSKRSRESPAAPLPSHLAPLLAPALEAADAVMRQRLFPLDARPPSSQEKTGGSTGRTPQNPRLLLLPGGNAERVLTLLDRDELVPVCEEETEIVDCGQRFVAAALLQRLEEFPVHSVSFAALCGDTRARSAEESLVRVLREAREQAPSVLVWPHVSAWWHAASPSLRQCMLQLLSQIQTAPILLLAVSDAPSVCDEVARLFVPSKGGMCLHVHSPLPVAREAFWRHCLSEALTYTPHAVALPPEEPEEPGEQAGPSVDVDSEYMRDVAALNKQRAEIVIQNVPVNAKDARFQARAEVVAKESALHNEVSRYLRGVLSRLQSQFPHLRVAPWQVGDTQLAADDVPSRSAQEKRRIKQARKRLQQSSKLQQSRALRQVRDRLLRVADTSGVPLYFLSDIAKWNDERRLWSISHLLRAVDGLCHNLRLFATSFEAELQQLQQQLSAVEARDKTADQTVDQTGDQTDHTVSVGAIRAKQEQLLLAQALLPRELASMATHLGDVALAFVMRMDRARAQKMEQLASRVEFNYGETEAYVSPAERYRSEVIGEHMPPPVSEESETVPAQPLQTPAAGVPVPKGAVPEAAGPEETQAQEEEDDDMDTGNHSSACCTTDDDSHGQGRSKSKKKLARAVGLMRQVLREASASTQQQLRYALTSALGCVDKAKGAARRAGFCVGDIILRIQDREGESIDLTCLPQARQRKESLLLHVLSLTGSKDDPASVRLDTRQLRLDMNLPADSKLGLGVMSSAALLAAVQLPVPESGVRADGSNQTTKVSAERMVVTESASIDALARDCAARTAELPVDELVASVGKAADAVRVAVLEQHDRAMTDQDEQVSLTPRQVRDIVERSGSFVRVPH